MHVYASTGHITLFQSTLMTRTFILRGKFGTWCFCNGVSLMDLCVTKTLLSAEYLLILTEKFAVDLGSILHWEKPTLRSLLV